MCFVCALLCGRVRVSCVVCRCVCVCRLAKCVHAACLGVSVWCCMVPLFVLFAVIVRGVECVCGLFLVPSVRLAMFCACLCWYVFVCVCLRCIVWCCMVCLFFDCRCVFSCLFLK